jgi:hypothetical protein
MLRSIVTCCLLFALSVSVFAGRPKPKKKTNYRPKSTKIVRKPDLKTVADSYKRGTVFPLKLSKNNRYLITQHNEPFLLNADAGWLLFHKLQFNQARQYIDNRHEHFFNTVFLQILPPEPDQKNAYNSTPFATQGDFSTPNDTYFKYVEDIVRYANSRQMMVGLVPAWLGCCGSNWAAVQQQNGVEKCKKYGEYLGTRLSKYDNVLWIMGGDRDPLGEEAVQKAIAKGIKSAAPNQLMTYHAASSHSSVDVFANESWLDLSIVYTYFRGKEGTWTTDMPQVYEVSDKEYQKNPTKAFILGESQYENENVGTEQMVRRQAYWTMLSGGAGHCYGSSVWAFGTNWQRNMNLNGALSMSRFYKIFSGLPWELLRPETSGELVVSGQGTYGEDDYSPVAVLPNYRLAMMYLPVGHPVKINMAQMKGSNLRVLWINPKTNQRWAGGYFKPRAVRELIPPTLSDDWILLIGNVGKK